VRLGCDLLRVSRIWKFPDGFSFGVTRSHLQPHTIGLKSISAHGLFFIKRLEEFALVGNPRSEIDFRSNRVVHD
jgi:hypothetical protein